MTDDHRAAALHDPSLFGGNQFDAIAKIGLVIERDRHDDRNGRVLDDIGGIEASAKTDFNDDGIGGMLGKQHESDGRQDFKHRDHLPGIGFAHAAHSVRQNGIADQRAAPALLTDAVTFVPIDQMRRCVDVNAETGSLQDGAGKGGHRALAVGARHMNDRRQPILRIAEDIEQPGDPVKREVEALRVKRQQLVDFLPGLGHVHLRHHRFSNCRWSSGRSCKRAQDAPTDVISLRTGDRTVPATPHLFDVQALAAIGTAAMAVEPFSLAASTGFFIRIFRTRASVSGIS